MWTFGFCTDGKRVQFHDRIVEAIRSLSIPDCEIIFCTENQEYRRPDVTMLYIGEEKSAWITKKKNEIAKHARHEHLCLLHDYAMPEQGWYEGFQGFGYEWDVCCMPVLQPDGERWWDWAHLDPHGLLDYTDLDKTGAMYVSGTAFCVKRSFLVQHPFNEELCWNQAEDREWSCQVRSFWNLRLNTNSVIRLLRFPRT